MFATIGRTWDIMKVCWGVLHKDRELIVFPIVSGIAMLILAAITFGVGSATGALERAEAAGGSQSAAALQAADYAFFAGIYFVGSFIVIYCNAALIGAAMIRIRGGDPSVWDGFAIANARLPGIIGWALVAATVGLILRILRDRARGNIVGQIILALGAGMWAYLTFMVIPVLIVDNVGPIEAIKRSGGIFKRTWGEQVTANFGFGIISFFTVLVAAIPAVLLFFISPVIGIAVGVVTVGTVIATVAALEGIFKAALYEYVVEEVVAEDFSPDLLGGAFVPKGAR
ncbi:MAG: DUF6159 family protein [Chloroflexota bacterium]|jgi:hypothetical protein|nr:DUF6159 family protein [Chloroflexota bacterium]MDP6507813.1 DUF6159 family protein [Chloroflexota bacterium]